MGGKELIAQSSINVCPNCRRHFQVHFNEEEILNGGKLIICGKCKSEFKVKYTQDCPFCRRTFKNKELFWTDEELEQGFKKIRCPRCEETLLTLNEERLSLPKTAPSNNKLGPPPS